MYSEKSNMGFLKRLLSSWWIPLFGICQSTFLLIHIALILYSCLFIFSLRSYGNDYVDGFKMNMLKLMNLLSECLTDETDFIWISAVPVSSKICVKSFNNVRIVPVSLFSMTNFKLCNFKRDLLLRAQNQYFQPHKMMYDIMEANTFSRNLVVTNGHDFLDIHYYLIRQQHRYLIIAYIKLNRRVI